MKKKIWEMVVNKYKDEASIKDFLIKVASDMGLFVIGAIFAFAIKVFIL